MASGGTESGGDTSRDPAGEDRVDDSGSGR
jgi:hypothetical protein